MSEELKSKNTNIGLWILQGALLIGIAGDFLLRTTPWGLNAFLWVLLVSVALVALTFNRRREFLNKETIMLHGALLFFAATFLYRASEPLLLLNVAAIFAIWAALTFPALKIKPKLSGVSHYFLGFIWSGINLLVSPILLVFNDVRWKASSESGWTRTVFPIVRGLLIASPLLIVFGGLFMAADAAFEGLIKRTLNIDTGEVFGHLLLIGFLSWIVAGYLRASLIGNLIPEQFVAAKAENAAPPEPKRDWREFNSGWLPDALTLGTIEIGIIWGLMNLLFLSFVIVQLPYLFGGFEYVQTTENVKLAEYARRGVAELGLVTALVLPVLLIGHWFIRPENQKTEKIFRVLAGVQIGLVFVIMLSSIQRMMLYTGSSGYGFTLERFYATAFLGVLAAIFVWFAITILSGFRQKFAWGMLWVVLSGVGFLNVINPSDYIVRANFRLMEQGRQFDVWYNFHDADEDATPAIVEILPKLSDHQRCQAENELSYSSHRRKDRVQSRNWNYSRMKAEIALENYKAGLGGADLQYKDCSGFSTEAK